MFETQTNRSGKVLSASCVGRKALLGIYYNNCFALDQNTNFLSDFFFFLLYDDKENKRGKKKIGVMCCQCILALFWQVVKGLDGTIMC